MRKSMILLLLLALVFAACGGGGGGEAEPGTTEGSPSGEETLGEFFGWSNDDPEAAEAEYRDQEARIQESIRQCMAEAGFEYQPMLPPEGTFGFVGEEFDEEEWVRTRGFGITTWYGNEEEMGEAMPGEEWVDPNQEMLESMSESESQAWYETLYGTEEEQMEGATSEVDPETGEEYTVTSGYGAGCSGEAYGAEYGDQRASEELWMEINPEMEAMYERVQADPRIVELDEEWSACMAEAGYQYESMTQMQESIYEDFQARFEVIVGPDGGYADPFADWAQEEIDAFFEEKTQEEIDAFFAEAEQTSRDDVDMEALAVLQQEEIDLAVADFECRGDYYEVYQEVTEDYEAEFIEQNREILEQIRDAQGG